MWSASSSKKQIFDYTRNQLKTRNQGWPEIFATSPFTSFLPVLHTRYLHIFVPFSSICSPFLWFSAANFHYFSVSFICPFSLSQKTAATPCGFPFHSKLGGTYTVLIILLDPLFLYTESPPTRLRLFALRHNSYLPIWTRRNAKWTKPGFQTPPEFPFRYREKHQSMCHRAVCV